MVAVCALRHGCWRPINGFGRPQSDKSRATDRLHPMLTLRDNIDCSTDNLFDLQSASSSTYKCAYIRAVCRGLARFLIVENRPDALWHFQIYC